MYFKIGLSCHYYECNTRVLQSQSIFFAFFLMRKVLLFPFHIWFSMLQVIMAPVFYWMTYFNTDFQVLNSCPNYWSFSMVTVLYGWFLYQPFKGKLFKDIRFYIVWNSSGFGWKMLTNCCTNLNTNLSPSSLSYFLSTQVQGFFFSCFTSVDFLCLL